MSTIKQKLVIPHLVENGGNVYRAMISAGYSHAMAKNSHKLTQSKGFKEAAEEAGLTEDFLLEALVSDIKAKPQKRTKEVELGFKVLGTLQEKIQPSGGDTYNTFIQQNGVANTPESKDLARNTLEFLMDKTKRDING